MNLGSKFCQVDDGHNADNKGGQHVRQIIEQLRARGLDSRVTDNSEQVSQCQNVEDGEMLCNGQLEPIKSPIGPTIPMILL